MLLPGETIQSQYAASPVIRALAESALIRIAPDADMALFYRTIFDIATAEGVGLDWVEIPSPVFGFAEADYEPFDVAPFWATHFLIGNRA